jgi:hypothetical protein
MVIDTEALQRTFDGDQLVTMVESILSFEDLKESPRYFPQAALFKDSEYCRKRVLGSQGTLQPNNMDAYIIISC